MRSRQPFPTSRGSCSRTSPPQALLAAAVAVTLAGTVPAQLQFEQLPRRGFYATASAAAFGDVDGDGDVDLVLGNWNSYSSLTRLYLNDGRGNFATAAATQMPAGTGNTSAVALRDLDGDGDLDVVVGNLGQQNLLYTNDGAGTFTDVTTTQMPADSDETRVLVLGDVDGDGDADLVIGNGAGQQNRLYLNDGSGNFSDATATQMPVDSDETHAAALGDVNGDGHLDLVFGNALGTAGQQNRLYINSGSGTFTAATATQLPADVDASTAVALGDVDGDNDLDLVVANTGSCGKYCGPGLENRLYLNDGSGTYTHATAAQFPADSEPSGTVVLGDIDTDGDLDVFVGNYDPGFYSSAPDRLYLNDGNGTFSDASHRIQTNGTTGFVAFADVDGDSDSDLLLGHVWGQASLRFNVQRQLNAPIALDLAETYTLDAFRRYGPTNQTDFAFPAISFAMASTQLPPFGTLGLDVTQLVALPLIMIPQPAGVGSLNVVMPNDAALIGLTLYSQALIVSTLGDARFSNVLSDAFPSAPIITSVSPPVPLPNTTVTVDGAQFYPGIEVRIGGNLVPIVTQTATSLTFLMPGGAVCDDTVELRNATGGFATDTINLSPVVTLMTPSGPATGGALFGISGEYLSGVTVTFNGVPLTNILNTTETNFAAITPPGTAGAVVVGITGPTGCSTTGSYLYL